MEVLVLHVQYLQKLYKKMLKTTTNKQKKHNKIALLARSKLNSIESKIAKALINNETGHEDFITIINEERSYQELKESIEIMKSQRSDTRKINLIKEGKKEVLVKLLDAMKLLMTV